MTTKRQVIESTIFRLENTKDYNWNSISMCPVGFLISTALNIPQEDIQEVMDDKGAWTYNLECSLIQDIKTKFGFTDEEIENLESTSSPCWIGKEESKEVAINILKKWLQE
jgi:hypothetical protein